MAESGSIAVLAEKPSVARDIARVLGATQQGEGYLHGNGYVVTWAIGHLAALAQPHEINPDWRHWRRDLLPMLPRGMAAGDLREDQGPVRGSAEDPQFARSLAGGVRHRRRPRGRADLPLHLRSRAVREAVQPAVDLFAHAARPSARAFDRCGPGSDYDPLADAARGRSRADWLVGMNLSRAYSLAYGEKDLSVGRVQTPTLAMLVERELAIRSFVPEDYLEVVATFHPAGRAEGEHATRAHGFANGRSARRSGIAAESHAAAAGRQKRPAALWSGRARAQAAIESIESQTQRMAPPPLYDLTELQRHANRLFGFSAQKTLDLAQALYERHKLISYPRTDSRHLRRMWQATLPRVVQAIAEPYRDAPWRPAPASGRWDGGSSTIPRSPITTPSFPTTTSPRAGIGLTAEEQQDLRPDLPPPAQRLARRPHLVGHDGDHGDSQSATWRTAITRREARCSRWVGRSWISRWPGKAGSRRPDEEENRDQQVLPPGLAKDQSQDVVDVGGYSGKRRGRRSVFTEATLLTAMETAGKTLDEKELSDAMKETGLGTPATRAAIIEVLLKRDYIVRSGKSLEATDKGIRLIEMVHPEVKSPAMTGQWEAYLHAHPERQRPIAALPQSHRGLRARSGRQGWPRRGSRHHHRAASVGAVVCHRTSSPPTSRATEQHAPNYSIKRSDFPPSARIRRRSAKP